MILLATRRKASYVSDCDFPPLTIQHGQLATPATHDKCRPRPWGLGLIVSSDAFELRPAVAADSDSIVDVWFSGWSEAHLGHVPDALLASRTEATFRDRIPEILDNIVVATVDERVVGLVVAAADEIEQLYVVPDQRGTGIAAALLDSGETAIAQQHRRAFLAVVDGNTRARQFYERRGWNDAGPFDYLAWTVNGEPVAVPCRRYEKGLGASAPPRPNR